MSRGARVAALVALYGAAVVWLTWPLAAHLGTHLPATHVGTEFDALVIAWALAHESRALAGLASFTDANIYHPTPHALFYCETGYGALPFFAPAFLLTGNPTLALNLTVLVPVALAAVVLHVVVRRWTGSHAAGFVAAWTLLTTRWLLWEWGPVAPNYAVVPYLPALLYLAAIPAESWRGALRLLPLLVLQAAVSIYLVLATLVPVAVVAAGRLLRRATRPAGARLAAVVVLAAVASVGIFAGHLVVFLENPALRAQTMWAGVPTRPTALPWGLFGHDSPTAVPRAVLLLVAAGAVMALLPAHREARPSRNAWAHAAVWATCGIVLSLTPVVTWYDTPVSLPTAALPLHAILRHPTRLGVVGLIGLAVLAGLAFAECTRRLATKRGLRTVLALVLATVMYRQYAQGSPGPTLRLKPLPPAYPLARAVARDDPLVRALAAGEGPVVELPIGAGLLPWPPWNAAAVYRSIFHRRPLLNGYNSYWPAAFIERSALARRLPDAGALARLRAETELATVVVHLDQLPDEQRRPWVDIAGTAAAGLRLVARLGDDLVFTVGPAG